MNIKDQIYKEKISKISNEDLIQEIINLAINFSETEGLTNVYEIGLEIAKNEILFRLSHID